MTDKNTTGFAPDVVFALLKDASSSADEGITWSSPVSDITSVGILSNQECTHCQTICVDCIELWNLDWILFPAPVGTPVPAIDPE